MKKYYAVKVGKQTGIFTSWDECRNSVDGFNGALYKSFKTEAEAISYLNGNGSNRTKKEQKNNTVPNIDEVVAYIDGSYNDELKRFSYAAVIFVDGEKITYSAAEDNPDVIEMRNVAGELKAAMYVMQFTKKQGKKS